MDKNFSKQFAKCPQCGSEDRFLEQLGEELKTRGLAREEWHMHYDVRQGAVLDNTKETAIPIGSVIPAFGIKTDICMNCGCIYAIDITRLELKKELKPQVLQPNRAQKRRDARGQDPPLYLS